MEDKNVHTSLISDVKFPLNLFIKLVFYHFEITVCEEQAILPEYDVGHCNHGGTQ